MDNKYSKEEAKSLKAGLFIAFLLIAVSLIFAIQKSGVKTSNDSQDYLLKAKFGRTNGLEVGDNVSLSGIVVGKVTKAILDENYNTILTLSVDNDIKVPTDSSASILSSSILGSKFISIEPGGDEEYMEEGDFFSYTQDAMVINELLERIIAIGKNNCGKNRCDNNKLQPEEIVYE